MASGDLAEAFDAGAQFLEVTVEAPFFVGVARYLHGGVVFMQEGPKFFELVEVSRAMHVPKIGENGRNGCPTGRPWHPTKWDSTSV